jgi:hypothetical protein
MTAPENASPENPAASSAATAHAFAFSKWELLGTTFLLGLAAYFLGASWRKWPDPIVDTGPQWYGAWRLSEGAQLYHDELVWNYGPLSAFFNAGLFRLFGPGMMVLVTANLAIYAAIVALAYAACRIAWGRLAAFAATAVFISFFSFLQLTKIGNYNYVTPYAHESTHGMLLILTTAFVAVRWARQPSRRCGFLLGLCGGLAAVLKPEFMLAGGAAGIAALVLRWRQRLKTSVIEIAVIALGLALPTAAFTAWFARVESWKASFIDASHAWWVVVVSQVQRASTQQETFSGFDYPVLHAAVELKATFIVVVILAVVWLIGWSYNRNWSQNARAAVAALAAAALAGVMYFVWIDHGWRSAGRCLPPLCLILLLLCGRQLARELWAVRRITESSAMAFIFSLLALMMLARMILLSRVYHLGFFQAALAGMAVTAALVACVPRWTGQDIRGRRLAALALLAVLGVGCINIAWESKRIRDDQTELVGTGADKFYAIGRDIDATGALVHWAAEKLRAVTPDATVCVFPGGEMINYLSRHRNPIASFADRTTEDKYVEQLRRVSPDFVVWLWRDLKEYSITNFGAPGDVGHLIRTWVLENYEPLDTESKLGNDPMGDQVAVGAVILRRKSTAVKSTSLN